MPPKHTKEEVNKIADKLCNKNNLIKLEDCEDVYSKFKAMTIEGYFVYSNVRGLRAGKKPLIFAKSNPYTIYNINLWIKLNDKLFELVSNEYNGNMDDLIWLCKNIKCKNYNKEFSKPWKLVQKDHACDDCGINKRIELMRTPEKNESLLNTYPEICDKYWDYERNDKTPDQYYPNSNQSVYWKCNKCNYSIANKLSINNIVNHGLSCPRCSDGISYPQKFLFNVFEQLLNTSFQTQLTKTTFIWCDKYKYDFYLNNYNCIVETHGNFHYKDSRWSKKEDVQQNDDDKEHLAKENGIINYIIIDCRKSELEWIKNSIMNSRLPLLLNFKETDIDWLKCHEYACNSLIKTVCDLWNNGIKKFSEIRKIVGLGDWAIIDYLKKGSEIGWCKYVPGEGVKRGHPNIIERKPIIQFSKKGEYINRYESITEASITLNLRVENISAMCHGRKKSVGEFIFVFEDDYTKTPEIVKNKCEDISRPKNVSYLLTGLTYIGESPNGEEYEFINQHEFAKIHGLNSRHINSCLLGKLKTHKKWKFRIKE